MKHLNNNNRIEANERIDEELDAEEHGWLHTTHANVMDVIEENGPGDEGESIMSSEIYDNFDDASEGQDGNDIN